MKFKILVKNDRDEWWESYDINTLNPQRWAEGIIELFNKTLRPKELLRILVKVEIENESNEKFHEWYKRTDGMSIIHRRYIVDIMQCRKCGVTGKRYGLNAEVKIDSKYSKKAYKECHTSIIEMSK